VPQWPKQAALIFEALHPFGWTGRRTGVGTTSTLEEFGKTLVAKAGLQLVGGAHIDACTKARAFANRH